MEKLLYDRRIGAVVLVLCVLLGLLYGPRRSLMSLRTQAEAIFTQGINGDGLSISRDLEQRADISYNLCTVAKRYLPEGDALITGLSDAAAMLSSSRGPQEKYRADTVLQDAFISLYYALGEKSLSEQDQSFRARLYDDFTSRGDTISRDGYNQAAQDFNRDVLGPFPANILGSLTGVEPLELYEASSAPVITPADG